MDAKRFDQLSRHLGTRTDRRDLFKSLTVGALSVFGIGALSQGVTAASSGYEGDTCDSAADCQPGLICQGSTTGLLGGALAEGPYGPPIDLPLLTGQSGRCRYRDGCAKSGQSCRRNSDCCADLNLHCPNNTCRRRN